MKTAEFAIVDAPTQALGAVCKVWDVSLEQLFSRRRYRRVAEARNAYYLITRRAGASWYSIAGTIGRGHQPAIVGARRLATRCASNRILAARVAKAAKLAGFEI